jgi:hypothetical protein
MNILNYLQKKTKGKKTILEWRVKDVEESV